MYLLYSTPGSAPPLFSGELREEVCFDGDAVYEVTR